MPTMGKNLRSLFLSLEVGGRPGLGSIRAGELMIPDTSV
jgi:hypothetical protein